MTTRAELPEKIETRIQKIVHNCEQFVNGWQDAYNDFEELRAAIREECARLEAAARREGYNERIKGQRLVTTRVLEERVAAARLAGRLEQAESTYKDIVALGPPSGGEGGDDPSCCDGAVLHIQGILMDERDRLRKAAGKK